MSVARAPIRDFSSLLNLSLMRNERGGRLGRQENFSIRVQSEMSAEEGWGAKRCFLTSS